MSESQPPIRFSEQLLGAEAQKYITIFDNFCKYFVIFYPLSSSKHISRLNTFASKCIINASYVFPLPTKSKKTLWGPRYMPAVSPAGSVGASALWRRGVHRTPASLNNIKRGTFVGLHRFYIYKQVDLM